MLDIIVSVLVAIRLILDNYRNFKWVKDIEYRYNGYEPKYVWYDYEYDVFLSEDVKIKHILFYNREHVKFNPTTQQWVNVNTNVVVTSPVLIEIFQEI